MSVGSASSLARHLNGVLATAPADDMVALLQSADEWAVSLETAHVLSGLVDYVRPHSVLEFGAGRSSLILARALQRCGGGRLTSVEHQPLYAERAWQQLSAFSDVDAMLVHSAIGLRFSKHGLTYQYTAVDHALKSRGPFALIFIDAPPGQLGRDSTLLRAARFAAPGAIVVLDDASRPREQTAVRRWARALDIETVFQASEVGRGIAVLRLVRPAAPAFSLRTFVGTIHDRILDQWQR